MSSKLFEYIHHKGCELEDRRARKAHPDLAAREELRKSHGKGLNIMADDRLGLTVEDFFADMETARSHRAWWHKVALHIHWWLQENGWKARRANRLAAKQRAERGWADRDTWSFDSYLMDVIIGGVTKLREDTHGYPSGLSVDQWDTILDEIVTGMHAGRKLHNLNFETETEAELTTKYEHAMDLLKDYMFNLWD